MYSSPVQRALGDIVYKVENAERLTREDGIRLMESNDLLSLGYMANLTRARRSGELTYFIQNNYVRHTNIDSNSSEIHIAAKLKTDQYNKILPEIQANTATMIYSPMETASERIDYLLRFRELQDTSKEFKAFVALVYPLYLSERDKPNLITGFEDLKVLAVSRLMLDNFPHIKVFWRTLGLKMAQVALTFGVDDIDDTILEEKLPLVSVTDNEQELSLHLVNMIKKAGQRPIQRDVLYTTIREDF